MTLRQTIDKGVAIAGAVGATPDTASASSQVRILPPACTHGGLPLIDALRLRHPSREYDNRTLPVRWLSELLCVAFGIHRSETSDRTAPYWRHVSVDAASIGQNVYLFCASEGLRKVFRGAFDPKQLAPALKLGDKQFITFDQAVGYPKARADLAA